ncbi:hypothetical protein [Marinirhabdus gelatinilytica]|uniref:WG repeat protein n=1 Tax=Marinirhabdus gelatinilytica TaxID=1703343 RepID=A0A370QAK9_9FLAO|nr:hypothetical protein [Marinirhabdus gelatinilytica]RDK85382.1 hypothetical protein C8D94_103207 [Marinirhabdus gelatinilytica]
MKKILMIAALAACTVGFAQNTNEKEVKTVKKTVVTDDDGVDVNTKEIKTQTKTDIALGKKTSYHNFNTKMQPTSVSTNVDYYNDGISYRFVPEKTGYYIVDTRSQKERVARLYPTSQKGYYIYTQDGTSSFGYFNADGDFVVESYDPDNDGVMNYVYKIKMDDNMKMKKKKKKRMKKEKMK